MMHRAGSGLGLLVALLLSSGCDDESPQCVRDEQCPGGQRCADGVCTPLLIEDIGTPDRPPPAPELGPEADVQPQWPDIPPTDGGPTCMPNSNGQIDRSEMLFVVPSSIHYTVGSGIEVNLEGVTAGGKTEWDLTADASDDHPIVSELEPVPSWTAAAYPGATYASLLSEEYGTYGVFKATQSALAMIGVVSKTADETQLDYSDPVDLLRFPVKPGESFETDATIEGEMKGVAVPLSCMTMTCLYERYEVDVLAAGKVKVPQLTLDAVLVKVKLVQYPAFNVALMTTTTTYMFVSECYGIVGKVVAEEEEPADLKKVKAKERQRITL